MTNQTLYVAISGHGYGHVGQVAPVVNGLCQKRSKLNVIVRCSIQRDVLSSLITVPFEHDQTPVDFGMLMRNPLDVLVDESHQQYYELHRDWSSAVKQEAKKLAKVKPDLILANIPYVILAAAKQQNISSVALSSLNWAEIYAGYCGDKKRAPAIIQQMRQAYESAKYFLKVTPSMDMPGLGNIKSIGPVTRVGLNQRKKLNQILTLDPSNKLVMASLGGIPGQSVVVRWPEIPGIQWLVTGDDWPQRADITPFNKIPLSYINALCSCDAMITKPGYGSVAEVVCNQIPVLYAKRHDWPEEPFLVEWLEKHGNAKEISREQLEQGDIEESLRELWRQPIKPSMQPVGINQAIETILSLIYSR